MLFDIINYALARGELSAVPFTGLIRKARVRKRQVKMGEFTSNSQYGTVIAEVPAVIARNLQRPVDERDLLILLHIPREVADEAIAAAQSVIIRPGVPSADSPPLIHRP